MIRAATEADLPKVAQIYEEILDLEEQTGVTTTNWQRGKYPTRDDARRALEAAQAVPMDQIMIETDITPEEEQEEPEQEEGPPDSSL